MSEDRSRPNPDYVDAKPEVWRVNARWCISRDEMDLLFRPGQARCGWSRKRKMKYIRRRMRGPFFVSYFAYSTLPEAIDLDAILYKRTVQ